MVAKSQELVNFENMMEKIVFDEAELKELKIAIKNFTEGKTSAKELKHLLLQCRGRMVEDITDFAFFFVKKKIQDLAQTNIRKNQISPATKVESQLRKEIEEKNELLETVARRIDRLVSKRNGEASIEVQQPASIEEVTEEIERCLFQIGAKQWIEMCYYEDYQFFVKLYPKLEALYQERFGESENTKKNRSEGKEIMANRMVKLRFPEEIETVVIKYIHIRNKIQHTMTDLSPSHLELAQDAFVKVLVYLIVNNLEPALLLNDKERSYAYLKDIFTRRLTGNRAFRKKILDRLKTVF